VVGVDETTGVNGPERARILVVDDEESQRSALQGLLETWGYDARTATDGAEALEKLRDEWADAIVTDLNMPRMDGAALLAELQNLPEAPPAIVLTAFGDVDKAVDTVHRLGAFWYLEKPVQTRALRTILERATAQGRLARHSARLERQLSAQGVLGGLVTKSPAMREVFSILEQAAPTRATILVTGETGTGKEVAARAIHDLSPRRARPFLALNCAALPESLIESELFGHEKGAFTGAAERRSGCFELANGGTLLLDEIGETPLGTQAKLLRVLEDRKVRRLGGSREIEVDVRIVAATNRDLKESVKKGTFREDLYFRLNVFEVLLPPLRSRPEDIPVIAQTLIGNLNRTYATRVTEVAKEVQDLFAGYQWPGNVRQLRNVLERAVILAGEGTIRRSHLPPGFAGLPELSVDAGGDVVTLRPGVTVEEGERLLILTTLRHTGGNRTRAANLLGLSVKTLFNKLKQYGEPEE
jgi:DNA-binding NtrC family response regulator